MNNEKLEQAESLLHDAEARLHKAEDEEAAAIRDIEKAAEDIEEATHPHVIHFEVDGERCVTDKHELTPDQIIREFGGRDPASNYLVQNTPGHKESYKDKGSIPIKMHDGMKFQILSTGPMTVSDVNA